MSNEGLERVGREIERQLDVIRVRIGADLAAYSVKPATIEISGQKLYELANSKPDEPIIINDKYHIVYIRDHVYHGIKKDFDREVSIHPGDCFVRGNKLHVYYCSVLQEMNIKGRGKRYQETSKIQNAHTIDLADGEVNDVNLPWCKVCIKVLQKKSNDDSKSNIRKKVAEYADAKELINCVQLWYDEDPSALQKSQQLYTNVITPNR